MIVLVWIITTITNLLTPIGLISTCFLAAEGDGDMFILPAILAAVGLVYGIFSWNYEVAPRMFWVKSKLELFENRVGCAIGSALTFFCSTVAIEVIVSMF